MGLIARESFWNSVSTYASIGLAAFNSVILVPRVFAIHPAEEWGLIQYLLGLVMMIGPLAHLGLPGSIVRFMPWFREKGKPEFLWLVTVIVSISFSLLAAGFVIFYFFLRPEPETPTLTTRFLPLILPMLAGNTLMTIAGSFAKAHYKTIMAVLVKELPLRVITSILLILYGLYWIDFEIFILVYVLTFLVKGLVMLFFVIRSRELSYRWPLRFPAKETTRDILVFTFFSFLGGEASAIVGKIDVILIKQFFDLKEVAYYSIPFYAASLIAAPMRSIAAISFTLISDYWRQNRMDKLQELYSQTAINQLLISGFIFLVVWLNVDVLMFILGEKFGTEAAKWVFLLVSLGQLINSASGVNGQIISASKHYRFGLYVQLILLVLTVIFQLIFIPKMGIVGAALGAGLAVAVFNVIKAMFLRYKFHLRLMNRAYYRAMLLLLVPLLLSYLTDSLFDLIWIRMGVRIAIVSLVFYLGIYLGGISPEIKKFIQKTTRKVFRT
jgi:O-antigen/teichoic acid export membrane protein